MSSPSPICQVKDGAGAYGPTTSGVNVTPANTITINLVSSAGVSTWSISCITTDELSVAATVNASLTIDNVAKTATFTAPIAGRAYRFQSKVNGGIDVNGVAQQSYTTTFGIYTRTLANARVHAVDETFESDPIFGYIADTNNIIRNPSASTVPTGTGFEHITGGAQDVAARAVNLTTADVTGLTGTGLVKTVGGTLTAASALLVDADVASGAALTVTKIAPSGTNENLLKTIGGAVAWGTVNLASSSAVGATILPVANGGTNLSSFGTNVSTFLGTALAAGFTTWCATPSSANLATLITDETGSGALVFGTSPAIGTPTITTATMAGVTTISGASSLTSNNAKGVANDINPVNLQTTTATPANLDTFTIASGSAVAVSWLVTVIQSTSATAAAFGVTACFRNNTGTVAQVGSTTITIIGRDAGISTATVTANNSGTTIQLVVTGVGATTLQWTSILTRLTVIP